MSLGEFAIIERFFTRPLPVRDDVCIGVGDDGAVLRIDTDRRLVTTLATASTAAWNDTHGDARRLGNDVMSVAMNRLAASGAQPAFATLALTLQDADERWLETFSDALFAVAAPLSVALVGGDTTRGPFGATVVGHGLVDAESERARPRVRVGDGIYVSGALGADMARARAMPSTIRVDLGRWVRACGGVAADLSEGLAAALASLLGDAGLGARIVLERLPLADGVRERLSDDRAWSALATARGDMELCLCLDPAFEAEITARADTAGIPLTHLARVDDSGVVVLERVDGRTATPSVTRRGAPSK